MSLLSHVDEITVTELFSGFGMRAVNRKKQFARIDGNFLSCDSIKKAMYPKNLIFN